MKYRDETIERDHRGYFLAYVLTDDGLTSFYVPLQADSYGGIKLLIDEVKGPRTDMTFTEADYDKLVGVVTDNAVDIAQSIKPEALIEARAGRGDEFHDRLFATVLAEVDDFYPELSKYEAADISEVCGEVESDVLNNDLYAYLFEKED